ncbi:MAG: hypothetical protein CL593_13480 [Alteromonas sp.]|uniref:2-keto-4-pentenoate hydratase n=1 Tax=Alteromonas australica TaxID=589873 RepID=UPI000C3C735E|nr:hypothetical protein [Alteromonas australica]MAB94333.1 hypothetical protein [Alteromonas sp.]|tara:strand:+ start:7991 stop:8809 length:819 start_codon:yes stop_codon:yes gene_type:complete
MLQFHTLTDEEVRQLSDTLFNARTTGKALPEFPGKLPATLEQAYAVQDLSIAASDDNVVGWKVGMVIPELREQMKSERIMGPVFKNVAHFIGHSHGDNEYIELPVYTDGFIAVEAELMIEINREITPGSIDTSADLSHLIRHVYTAVEIASSPVKDLNDYGPTAIIADFGNNHGMVVGAPIEDWQSKIATIETKCFINDELINSAPANNVLNGPMAAFSYLIDQASKRNITLPKGTMVCSGAITGVHETLVGSTSTVDFGEAGKINMKLVAF